MAAIRGLRSGHTHSMDLFQVRRADGGETRLGFLSLGWGIIADVDIDSEPLRYDNRK
jgi:diacylglycerol kinase family enzyme